jgi:DegV family protein with EDD domain
MSSIPSKLTLQNTRIVVDTSSNVPDEQLKRFHALEVPTLVIFGQESYRNKLELTEAQFYAKFAASSVIPTTSQPPPAFFMDAYRTAFAEGAEHIIVCTVSSKLSGTHNSATLASQEFGIDRFTMVDTHFVSLAAGFQMMEAGRMLEAGVSQKDLLHRLDVMRQQTVGYAALETLKYIARSGRISNIQAGIGELLQVKPILAVTDHAVAADGRVRGRKKSLQEIVDRVALALKGRRAIVGVPHANAPEDAQTVEAEARARLQVAELYVSDLGPAIATLAGPGTVALLAVPLA